MVRKIIRIDGEKCTGCGACARACHEGAIGLVAGKAVLLRDDYCDGMGDCLPQCPAGAITFEEREAAPYDQAAVAAHRPPKDPSRLQNWPVQLRLAPLQAPWYQGAALLVAADCTAFAYAALHPEFMAGRVTLIGCPKLDRVDYSEKLQAIIRENDIRSITVVRMEVPCCGGLAMAVQNALTRSGKSLPCQIVTISIEGKRI